MTRGQRWCCAQRHIHIYVGTPDNPAAETGCWAPGCLHAMPLCSSTATGHPTYTLQVGLCRHPHVTSITERGALSPLGVGGQTPATWAAATAQALLLLPITATATDESAKVYTSLHCQDVFCGFFSELGDGKAANHSGWEAARCVHTEHVRALLTALLTGHWYVYPVQQPPGR